MSAFSIGATLLDAMVLALLTKEDTYGYQITKDIQEPFAVTTAATAAAAISSISKRSTPLLIL